jgi:predicted aspartyl protease
MTTRNWNEYMGRFSVELEVSNDQDVVAVALGVLTPEKVRRAVIRGVVDTGATRLVLPGAVASALGLAESGTVMVSFADGRKAERRVVSHVQVTIQGRSGVFSAVVEPGRSDALVGAIVLEELDFLPDCTAQKLVPRDPKGIIAEIE